jgi:hypothetical protein
MYNIVDLVLSFPTHFESTQSEFEWKNYDHLNVVRIRQPKTANQSQQLRTAEDKTEIPEPYLNCEPQLSGDL